MNKILRAPWQIGGTIFQAYGNIQLLDNPFKEQVVVHRADSPGTRECNRAHWLYTAANGGFFEQITLKDAA